MAVGAIVGLGAMTISPTLSAATPTTSNLACATRVVSTWSLTRVARETVVVSAQASSLASLTSSAAQGYGGFLLFGSLAPATLPVTLASLRGLEPDRLVPMVMTDDEGGGIIRFPNLVGHWPWAQVMGSTMTPARIVAQGERVGAAMVRAGLNVDLAPVADVDGRAEFPGSANPDGYRSFGGSPTVDAADVAAFATGLLRAHVVAVVKHFPGLGGGDLDSHRATPSIACTWPQIWEQDLEPYRALAASLPLITVSHAAYPKIERPPLPASLSRFWIQDVLRNKLRYRGLVTSDDMEMGGVLQDRSPEDAAIDAIAAGTDLLEICQRADRILATHEALLREAERSPAFARCVSRAAKRVANAKRRLLGYSALPRPLSAAGLKHLQAAQQRLREKIARANARVNARADVRVRPEATE